MRHINMNLLNKMNRMKKLVFAFLMCLLVQASYGQQISRNYNNRSMSEVLKDLDKTTQRYKISFIYNELEDFTVTTSFRNLSLQEALGQVFGFYPIKATIGDSLIFVECTQKEPIKLMGRVVDEHRRPVEFANVALLNPSDSAFLTGGVTNASGNFVIPCGMKKVIAKVSCVGYYTCYNIYNVGRVGNITLRESAVNIKGVVVKAKRPSFKMGQEGMQVDIQHTDLAKVGDALDVFRELPRLNVSNNGAISVYGKGTPLVYVNSKLVKDVNELRRLKSDDVKNVEIITSPGAKYDATESSIIRIRTVKRQGEGLSGSFISQGYYKEKWGGFEQVDLKYQNKGMEVFSTLFASSSPYMEHNTLSQYIEGTKAIHIKQYAPTVSRSTTLDGTIGFNYDFNENHSVGGSYNIDVAPYDKGHVNGIQSISVDGVPKSSIQQSIQMQDAFGPTHEANLYYVGKAGKMGIDFDGTYVWKKGGRDMQEIEDATGIESREVHTSSTTHNRLVAGKLVLSYPVGKGKLELGSEVTATRSRGVYANEEGYVASSSTDVKESNVAGFFSMAYPLGNLSLSGGVRYEHVTSNYYSFGEWQAEPSRKYNNWFPNLSLGWNKGNWAVSLSYTCKTQRPNYNSLRNEMQYDNRFMYEGGNPYLRPTAVNDFSLDVVYSWLTFGVNYKYEDNPIIWFATLYNNEDIIFLRNLNFACNQSMSMYLIAAPKFGWYCPTWQLFYQQQYLDNEKYGVNTKLNKPAFGVTWNNKFLLGPTFTGWLTLHGNTYSCSGFQRTRPGYYVSLRLVKTFCNDKLNFSLSGNDIFRSQKEQWTMLGNHVTLIKDSYNCNRSVVIRVTYKFNATRSKYKGSGAGNDERHRL